MEQKSDIQSQTTELLRILDTNPNIKSIFKHVNFPNNMSWYLAGGCINQTVWNFITKRSWDYCISDYDIFYWDDDLSEAKESNTQQIIRDQFKSLNCELDVNNIARVHCWFSKYFGFEINQYSNIEEDIASMPSTVTGIGVTVQSGKKIVYAPFGLSDLFSMKLRYNPETLIPIEFVIPKIEKWKTKWPELIEIKNSYPR